MALVLFAMLAAWFVVGFAIMCLYWAIVIRRLGWPHWSLLPELLATSCIGACFGPLLAYLLPAPPR